MVSIVFIIHFFESNYILAEKNVVTNFKNELLHILL